MNAVEKVEPQTEPRAVANVTPMSLLESAVANGNLDLAEKLMSLQDRWEANQARKAFDAAMAMAKAEIPVIVRNATGHNSKKYADFAAIAKVVDPILGRHGLYYRFRTVQTDKAITVTCVLFGHGHSEETTLSGPADSSGNKNAIQAIGSTLTYLQRYSLVQMLGIAAGNDDDGKASGDGGPINADQVSAIDKLITDTGTNLQRFCGYMKVEAIADIPAKSYQRAIDALNAKKAQS